MRPLTFGILWFCLAGEVSSQPYEDGIAWDSELDQQHAQAALGWRMTAGVTPDGQIEITARDRAGQPLALPRIVARLERPATEQGKLDLAFTQVSAGVWRANPGRVSGAWDLRLAAYDPQGRQFDAERRLIWP